MSKFNNFVMFFMPIMPSWLIRRFADRYIAGIKMSEALDLLERMNSQKMVGTLDLLGESAKTIKEATDSAYDYLKLLDEINRRGLDANVSVKLTQMGLLLDKNLTISLVEKIAERAKKYNNFVRIDMEHSAVTSDTIEVYQAVQDKYGNLGIVLQAYLKRTSADLKDVIKINGNIRLCKGIYLEPEEIAYKDPEVVREKFMSLLEKQLASGNYVGIATHDDVLVDRAEKLIKRLGKRKEDYEFQMLLGVSTKLQDRILKGGHKLRLYLPFGEKWYEYSMRRFRENPNMVGHIFRNMFHKYRKI